MAGWVKLNSDAAVTNHGAKAAAGGVVRDSDGNFILGYASDIGEATTTVAELQAILMGLKLVWRRGFTKVTMETDSLTSVCLIQGGCSSMHPCSPKVLEIQGYLQRIQECHISHTLREANQVADGFAKFGLRLTACSKTFEFLPSFVSIPFFADIAGSVFPRGF